MPFVNQRWPGGMLTNFKTIRRRSSGLRISPTCRNGALDKRGKKEALQLRREMDKLEKSLGGIKHMDSLPDVLFVIDVGHEAIALKEAKKLGIPVVAVVDTNCAPEGVDYVMPGNDDAMRAIACTPRAWPMRCSRASAQAPAVIVGEDDFVELDESGNPRQERAAGAAAGAGAAARSRVRPRPLAAPSGGRASPPIRKTVPSRPCSRTPPKPRRAAPRSAPAGGVPARACRGPWSRRRRRSASRLWRRRPHESRTLMTFTAEAVRQLRERTGAGMMECKKALVETGGDLDAAAELMRKQGLAKADKKASRVAAEGVIATAPSADGMSAVLVEVNCETDFVARGDDFRAFAKEVAAAALAGKPGLSRRWRT